MLETGKLQGVQLKGATPQMAYKEKVVTALKDAMTERFELNDNQRKLLHATKLLHLKNWQNDDKGSTTFE